MPFREVTQHNPGDRIMICLEYGQLIRYRIARSPGYPRWINRRIRNRTLKVIAVFRYKMSDQQSKDLLAARRIAADHSMQTGKNREKFMDGTYDQAYGVRTALEAIAYGRRTRED